MGKLAEKSERVNWAKQSEHVQKLREMVLGAKFFELVWKGYAGREKGVMTYTQRLCRAGALHLLLEAGDALNGRMSASGLSLYLSAREQDEAEQPEPCPF